MNENQNGEARSIFELLERLNEQNDQLTGELNGELSRLNRLTSEVIWALASAVDAKDPYTNGHSGRVADYSWMIAKKLGKDKCYQRELYYVALLHDIGKIGIPDAVLTKPARLTDEEYMQIRNHPVIGSMILDGITTIPSIATGAKYHHERYDGKGYPDGLSGEQIPEMARIIAVADTYDAMTSRRTYKKVITQAEARAELERSMGTQLDPEITRVMLELIDEDTDYDMHG